MLGYINERAALDLGFTHHGVYLGVPIWVSDHDEAMTPKLGAIWPIMLVLMSLDWLIRKMMSPTKEVEYWFYIGDRIEVEE